MAKSIDPVTKDLKRGASGSQSTNDGLNARRLGGVQTVAGIVAASSENVGVSAFVSDGAAGNPVDAVSDGTNWIRSDTRATIAAS